MRKSNRHTKRTTNKRFVQIFVFCVCLIAGIQFLISCAISTSNDRVTYKYASEENGWNLILINGENHIPEDYEVDLILLSNGEQVDSRMYPALQEMFDDARTEGYGLFVRDEMAILYIIISFILPNFIWQIANRRKIKNEKNMRQHILWTYIFFIYCGLALYVAGIGTVCEIKNQKKMGCRSSHEIFNIQSP